MRINVYIDGFNLFFGCLRGSPYKWLDIEALCPAAPPQDHINRIRYFTALVTARPGDPQQPVRQQTYLRALASLRLVSVHLGEFYVNRVRRCASENRASQQKRPNSSGTGCLVTSSVERRTTDGINAGLCGSLSIPQVVRRRDVEPATGLSQRIAFPPRTERCLKQPLHLAAQPSHVYAASKPWRIGHVPWDAHCAEPSGSNLEALGGSGNGYSWINSSASIICLGPSQLHH
jgi:hypothetical protein